MKGFAKLYLKNDFKAIYKDLNENNTCKKIVLDDNNHFFGESTVDIIEEIKKNPDIIFFNKIPPKLINGSYKEDEYIYLYKLVNDNLLLKYKYTKEPFKIVSYFYCDMEDEKKKYKVVFSLRNQKNRYYYKYLKENDIS